MVQTHPHVTLSPAVLRSFRLAVIFSSFFLSLVKQEQLVVFILTLIHPLFPVTVSQTLPPTEG